MRFFLKQAPDLLQLFCRKAVVIGKAQMVFHFVSSLQKFHKRKRIGYTGNKQQ